MVSGVPLPSLNRMILPPTEIFPRDVVRWPNNYMDQCEMWFYYKYKNMKELIIYYKWSKMSIPWPRQHASAMYSPAAIGEGPEGNIKSVQYRDFVLESEQNRILKLSKNCGLIWVRIMPDFCRRKWSGIFFYQVLLELCHIHSSYVVLLLSVSQM